MPDATSSPARTPVRRLRPALLARGAGPVSLVASLALHAALVGAGLMCWRAATVHEPPRLILPYGWASDLDGRGEAGVTPLGDEFSTRLAEPGGAAPPAWRISLPPGELAESAIIPPAVRLNESMGTMAEVELPGLRSDDAPPAVSCSPVPAIFRGGSSSDGSPEALGAADGSGSSGLGDGVAGAGSSAGQAGGAGRSDSGTGRGDGGAPLGVLDGSMSPDVRNRAPLYPPIALRNGWSGTVLLEMDVDERGRVTSVRIAQSSGYDVLDRSAVETAQTWQFTPARMDGQPVAVTVRRVVNFIRQR